MSDLPHDLDLAVEQAARRIDVLAVIVVLLTVMALVGIGVALLIV